MAQGGVGEWRSKGQHPLPGIFKLLSLSMQLLSIEGGDLFEGDIVMAREPDGSGRAKRNAQRARQYLWSGRVVPYDFDSSLPGNLHLIMTTLQQHQYFHNVLAPVKSAPSHLPLISPNHALCPEPCR